MYCIRKRKSIRCIYLSYLIRAPFGAHRCPFIIFHSWYDTVYSLSLHGIRVNRWSSPSNDDYFCVISFGENINLIGANLLIWGRNAGESSSWMLSNSCYFSKDRTNHSSQTCPNQIANGKRDAPKTSGLNEKESLVCLDNCSSGLLKGNILISSLMLINIF